jgi:hypothetical protein
MTNSTDLFQAERESLALPGQGVIIFVDGVLCEDLEPIDIVRSGWPQFDRARLAFRSPAHDLYERIEDRLSLGAPICIQQLYDANSSQQGPLGLPVFVGQIETVEAAITEDSDSVEIVARDLSAVLERITVYGQRLVQSDGSAALLAGLQTAFNPAGKGNAATQPTTLNGRTYTNFSSSASESRLWTCGEAITYLLSEYVPAGILHWPDAVQLEAIASGRQLRDLDVTGMTLLEALYRCADSANLVFRFVPQLTEIGPRQAIVFYQNGTGRSIELNAQPTGQPLSISRANVAAVRSTRHFYPVTHRTIGQGDFKVYEATFELVKAWDPALEDTDYAKFSASTNPDFSQVKDVYRKWCLNEAGDYTPAPYSRGEPFDFGRIFEGGGFVPRRRRFWPALTSDKQGRSIGYFPEISYDGVNWWQYLHPFNILLDECGVWLSADRLDMDTWVAALKGVLRFRITASIISDERLTCVACQGPVGSAAPIVDHLVTLPRQFQYRKVSPYSALWRTNAPSDQVDDTAALNAFVRAHAAGFSPIVESVHVQTESLWLHLHPGDLVTCGPDSRDWLGCRRDGRSMAWVEQVRMDFRRQCTDLSVVRQRQS